MEIFNFFYSIINIRILDLYKLHVQEGKMADLEIFASDDIFEPLNENKNDYTEQSINEKQALIDNFIITN